MTMQDFTTIRRNMKKQYGDMVINRCSGKSTKIALRIIADAYAFPNTKVYINDHHGTPKADEHLAESIDEYIRRLGFSGFKIVKDRNKLYLQYELVGWD